MHRLKRVLPIVLGAVSCWLAAARAQDVELSTIKGPAYSPPLVALPSLAENLANGMPKLEPPNLFEGLQTQPDGARAGSGKTESFAAPLEEGKAAAEEARKTLEGDLPSRVGLLGDPERIDVAFEQGASFTAESIRKAVRCNVVVSWHSGRAAPLADYLRALRKAVAAGYKGAGFAHVEVAARRAANEGRIALNILEGPRYRTGAVHVRQATGAYDPDGLEPHILRALTSPLSAEQRQVVFTADPDFTAVPLPSAKDSATAKPVVLCAADQFIEADEAGLLARRRCVELECAERGHPFAQVGVEWDTTGPTTADLDVTIYAWGPRADFQRLRLEGNQRETEAEVVRLLELEPGTLLTPAGLTKFVEKLDDSGRFRKVTARLEATAERDAVDLVIRVQEAMRSPALSEPLSDAELALLRFRRWLAEPDRWSADAVVEVTAFDGKLEMALAPSGATALALDIPAVAAGERIIAVSDDQQIAFGLPRTGSAWVWSAPREDGPCLRAEIGFRLDASNEAKSLLGWSVKSKRRAGALAPPKIDLRSSFCLDLLRQTDVTARLADGEWTVAGEGWKLTFEDATGRGVAVECGGTSNDGPRLSIRWAAGVFEPLRQKRSGELSALTNCCDQTRSAPTLAAFVVSQWLARHSRCTPEARELGSKLAFDLVEGVSRGFEQVSAKRWGDGDDEFMIPSDPQEHSGGRGESWTRLVMSLLCDDMFVRNTSAAEALRFVSYSTSSGTLRSTMREQCRVGADNELQGLLIHEPTAGPLVSWVLRELGKHPSWRWLVANRQFNDTWLQAYVLPHLDAAHFRGDCAGIVDPGGVVGVALGNAAETLRAADATTALALVELLPLEQRGPCAAFVRSLHKTGEQPIDSALLDALEAGWREGWREALERQFAPPTSSD